jgi:hypothetical protein
VFRVGDREAGHRPRRKRLAQRAERPVGLERRAVRDHHDDAPDPVEVALVAGEAVPVEVEDELLVGGEEDLEGRAFPNLPGEVAGRAERQAHLHPRVVPEGLGDLLDGELQVGGRRDDRRLLGAGNGDEGDPSQEGEGGNAGDHPSLHSICPSTYRGRWRSAQELFLTGHISAPPARGSVPFCPHDGRGHARATAASSSRERSVPRGEAPARRRHGRLEAEPPDDLLEGRGRGSVGIDLRRDLDPTR